MSFEQERKIKEIEPDAAELGVPLGKVIRVVLTEIETPVIELLQRLEAVLASTSTANPPASSDANEQSRKITVQAKQKKEVEPRLKKIPPPPSFLRPSLGRVSRRG